MPDPNLDLFTIYDRPRDAPTMVRVRRWIVAAHGETIAAEAHDYPTLEEARDVMRARGLTQISRAPDDDAVIVETWI